MQHPTHRVTTRAPAASARAPIPFWPHLFPLTLRLSHCWRYHHRHHGSRCDYCNHETTIAAPDRAQALAPASVPAAAAAAAATTCVSPFVPLPSPPPRARYRAPQNGADFSIVVLAKYSLLYLVVVLRPSAMSVCKSSVRRVLEPALFVVAAW